MSFEKRKTLTGIEKLVYEVKGEMDKTIVAVSLYLENSEYSAIEFYSYLFGVAKFNFSNLSNSTHAWESENDAQDLSTPNYHYTGKILNELEDQEMLKKIILDCLSHIESKEVYSQIIEILESNNLRKFTE